MHRRSHRNARPASPRTAGNRLLFETLEPRQVLSAVADLLFDVNPNPVGQTGSTPESYAVNGDHALFFTSGYVPTELWRTDGTEAGTTRVRTFQFGGSTLTNVNGVFYFSAGDARSDAELWRTDGTAAGTWMVKDFRAAGGSGPSALTNVNGTLYFQASDAATGSELWKSDGTAAGTVVARDIRPGTASSLAQPRVNFNGALVFTAENVLGSPGLFIDDGLTPQPTLLGTFSSSPYGGPFNSNTFTQVGSTLYFTAHQSSDGIELWKTDGTVAGTLRVADVNPAGNDNVWNLVNVSGTLFFASSPTDVDDAELWKSDGTAAGTVRVKDIRPGAFSSSPDHLFNYNGILYFAANDGVNGAELWRSDGTAAGTVLVQDANPGVVASNPSQFANINGTLYFSAVSVGGGSEMYKLDGDSVALVRDIFPGAAFSNPSRFTNFNGQILFTAVGSAASGTEPWISDGTAAGTRLVKDIRTSTDSSNPSVTVDVDGIHYFIANDGAHGNELWRTDGTSAGTYLVKDVHPGAASAFNAADARYLVNVNGKLYFAANDGANGVELWVSDGTAAGTKLVADANTGASGSFPRQFTNVGGVLYYAANDAAGAELWRSDGTAAGTTRVANIGPGPTSSLPDHFVVADGTLYFTAVTPATDRELWRLAPGESTPVQVTSFAMAAIDAATARLTVVGDKVFFLMSVDSPGDELWVADSAGTRRVVNLQPSGSGGAPTNLLNVNGTLFFTPLTADHGRELWRSNGTPEGTFEVLDIVPGSTSSNPLNLVNVNGTLFFSATTPANGNELWKSNGTAAGTRLAADVMPGPSSSFPLSPFQTPQYVVIGEWLYFVARPQSTNTDVLYRIKNTATHAELLTDAYSLSGRQTKNLINLNGSLAFAGSENNASSFGVELYILRESTTPLAGDYTGDGVVDGADFLAWQRSYNTRVEPFGSGADGSGNGSVNVLDLDVLKINFGKQLAPAEVAATELAATVSTPPAIEPLAALDAAFALEPEFPAIDTAPASTPVLTTPTPAPTLSLGAAAITIRQATSVDAIARPPRPIDHHPRVIDRHAAFAPEHAVTPIPLNSPLPRPRTASLQRPVDATVDAPSAELTPQFPNSRDASLPAH